MSHVFAVYLSTQTPSVPARLTSPLLWHCIGATFPVTYNTKEKEIVSWIYFVSLKWYHDTKTLWIRTMGTHASLLVVEEVLLWKFLLLWLYTTSYLIFRHLLSTDSSRMSRGKRTISLSCSPCENTVKNITVTAVSSPLPVMLLTKSLKWCHIIWTIYFHLPQIYLPIIPSTSNNTKVFLLLKYAKISTYIDPKEIWLHTYDCVVLRTNKQVVFQWTINSLLGYIKSGFDSGMCFIVVPQLWPVKQHFTLVINAQKQSQLSVWRTHFVPCINQEEVEVVIQIKWACFSDIIPWPPYMSCQAVSLYKLNNRLISDLTWGSSHDQFFWKQ